MICKIYYIVYSCADIPCICLSCCCLCVCVCVSFFPYFCCSSFLFGGGAAYMHAGATKRAVALAPSPSPKRQICASPRLASPRLASPRLASPRLASPPSRPQNTLEQFKSPELGSAFPDGNLKTDHGHIR